MSDKADRRPLSQQQIDILMENGCSAGNWSDITVPDGFIPENITNVNFLGKVSIGLHTIIRNVLDCIANYDIGENVFISGVRRISFKGPRSFGNGVRVAAVNENGGREIPIFEGLSAQIAYLMTMYRHDAELIDKLEAMVSKVISHKTSEQGVIADGARIMDCGVIYDVNVGQGAHLNQVSHLRNGTILSNAEDHTEVGTNVIARDFIFAEGSKVTDATQLKRCFVGQGVKLENGFSAVDSVFFANSHFEQGEACSVFAGPFSVSHHKSTLLIAGMYSFYNAGSGTNNSNHMYKLGPMHQGILERGCKTGSESYLMWPSRLGAFTTVIGKHIKWLDLSNLPFSLLFERNGKSELFVGLNLTSVGLVRDEQKWPKRDSRKMSNPADQVNAKVFTPYTAQKMLAGVGLLRELDQKHAGADHVLHQGIAIRTPARGIELYQLALDQYFGDVLLARLNGAGPDELQSRLQTDTSVFQWADLAGLIAPVDAVSALLDDVKAGNGGDMATVTERLRDIADKYSEYEWTWVAHQLETQLGKPISEWQGEDISGILKASLEASEKLTALQIEDANKEFALSTRIGYGIDGDNDTQFADFSAVCGSAETNATIQNLKEALEQKKALVEEIVQNL